MILSFPNASIGNPGRPELDHRLATLTWHNDCGTPLACREGVMMDPENIIKGRIAEAIIEELLRTSGNRVYRFGYESILQNLVQHDSRFDRHSGNGEQVRSIPDFVVVNTEGRSFFVEVKFRSDPVWLLKTPLLKQLKEYWQAKLILVTITKPYFRIVDPQFLFDQDYAFERWNPILIFT
jgi:hypothetical protein